jgi:hypothetical protein
VDLVAEVNGEIIPFEVKYRAQHTGLEELKGLLELCDQKQIARGYVVTKSVSDLGPMKEMAERSINGKSTTDIMRIPATLLCYWLGAIEVSGVI